MNKSNFSILSKIWKRIGSPKMNNFSDRLLLQKKVYLLQELGLNLGYNFTLYIYGPYSSQLASDGYKSDLNDEISIGDDFEDVTFKKLEELERDHKDDSLWFELLGTIVYLVKQKKKNKQEVIGDIKENKSYLYQEKTFEEAWERLTSIGIF